MQKYTAWMIPIALMALSGCGQKEITNYDTIERTVRRANQKCEETHRELGAALAILDIPDEAAQEKQLKTAVIRKNKEWDKKDWLAMSWRRMATGLQGYRNFPFHTYKDYIDQYQKELKRNWNQLTRINVVDVNRLRNKVDELIKKLEELSEMIESHDRYLAEADKMGLILTRPASKQSAIF
jgi:hypothetical protein